MCDTKAGCVTQASHVINFVLNPSLTQSALYKSLVQISPVHSPPSCTISHSMSFHSAKEDILRFTFVVFDFIGFILFDLLYIAVVISYASQCQLLRLYIGTIIDRVLTKLQGYTLEQAMTDINQTYQFLKVLNGKLSVLTTVCLLIFIEAAGSCEWWGGCTGWRCCLDLHFCVVV